VVVRREKVMIRRLISYTQIHSVTPPRLFDCPSNVFALVHIPQRIHPLPHDVFHNPLSQIHQLTKPIKLPGPIQPQFQLSQAWSRILYYTLSQTCRTFQPRPCVSDLLLSGPSSSLEVVEGKVGGVGGNRLSGQLGSIGVTSNNIISQCRYFR
jgi:hypothetical protein